MRWWEYAMLLAPWMVVFTLWLFWFWHYGWWTIVFVLIAQVVSVVGTNYYARWRGYS